MRATFFDMHIIKMILETFVNLDKSITNRLKAKEPMRSNLFWKLGAFFAHSGDSWFWMAALGLIWLFIPGDWHRRAAILGASIVFQAVLVLAIKFSIRRSRPPGEWGAIYRNTDPHSFPSGHATRAFMLAAMAWGLGPQWFGLLTTLWAPLVSLARVYVGVHYFSDILAGALLGLLIGWVLLVLSPSVIAFFPWVF